MRADTFSLVGNWIAASRALEPSVASATATLHLSITRGELREMFSDDVVERRHVHSGETRIIAYAATTLGGVRVEVWADTESRERTVAEVARYNDAGQDVLSLDGIGGA